MASCNSAPLIALVVLVSHAAGVDANMASSIMNDVRYVAQHSKDDVHDVHAALPPAPRTSSNAQTAVILRNFQKAQEQMGTPPAPPAVPSNAFLKDDTDTRHYAQAGVKRSARPLWQTIVNANNVPATDLRSKSKMLLKHMKEVEKITGTQTLNHLKSFKTHYLKELNHLHKTAVDGGKKKTAPLPKPVVKVHEAGAHPDEESKIKQQMKDTIKQRMIKNAQYVGESSTSNVVKANAVSTPSDTSAQTNNVDKSSAYLKKLDKHMSRAGKKLQKEMDIAKKEAEHTDHGNGGAAPSVSDEGDLAPPPPPPSGPAGFIAEHTWDPHTDPEVQWQLAGHGEGAEEADAEQAYQETEGNGEGEGEVAPASHAEYVKDHQPGSDVLAKMKVGQVQHMVAMIGGKHP